MTPEQYQQHVLGLLATTFPDEEFEGSPDPFLIKYGQAELGLRNLYALHTQKLMSGKKEPVEYWE